MRKRYCVLHIYFPLISLALNPPRRFSSYNSAESLERGRERKRQREKNSEQPRSFSISDPQERKPATLTLIHPFSVTGRFTTQFTGHRRIRFVPRKSPREFAFVIGPKSYRKRFHDAPTPRHRSLRNPERKRIKEEFPFNRPLRGAISFRFTTRVARLSWNYER